MPYDKTMINAAKTRASELPGFVKNADVDAESINDPAIFSPWENTALGDRAATPEDDSPICSKL